MPIGSNLVRSVNCWLRCALDWATIIDPARVLLDEQAGSSVRSATACARRRDRAGHGNAPRRHCGVQPTLSRLGPAH
jgi:hypothetical protein